jgi:hypothetical protein
MKLKKDEKIIKKRDIRKMGGFQPSSPGTLYLTTQRLILEYYDTGIPFLSLFSKPTKKEIEIPLTAIRNVQEVKGISPQVKVEYKIKNKPEVLYFSPDLPGEVWQHALSLSRLEMTAYLSDEGAHCAKETVGQIRKAAKLPAKK